jgi:hypothetical protein
MHFDRYRWQDHVPSPSRWKADLLIVLCFAALLVGFGVERMHQENGGIRKVAMLVHDPVAPAHAAVVTRIPPKNVSAPQAPAELHWCHVEGQPARASLTPL